MEEKIYYWGLKLPLLGVIRAFRFRSRIPLEKRELMNLYPDKYRQFLENGVIDITLYNRWDITKMKIMKFLGILTSTKAVIVIPED